MADRQVIAVLFGGRSVEHDVSILTGLQFLEALDPERYSGLPVYIDPLGHWWTGAPLLRRSQYPIKADDPPRGLQRVRPDLARPAGSRPRLVATRKGLFGTRETLLPFDLAVPALHGSNGEDGTLQGLLDFADIPYAGCRTLAAAATMDKAFFKSICRDGGLTVLPDLVVDRPEHGQFLDPDTVAQTLSDALGADPYPLIVKPCNLGSSVGVQRATDRDGLMAALTGVFRLDGRALVEPCVTSLVEYNVAVRRAPDGRVLTSAIERPLAKGDVLDFANKYRAGGDAGGPKLDGAESEGMASLNRELDPESLSDAQARQIRETAESLFDGLDLAGSVRVDFLADADSGDLWLNEVNTCPGSFAYFLWEAAETRTSFLDLTHDLIREGFRLSGKRLGLTDAAAGGATLFKGRD
ncbi:D-alanine--D-alanine ligase [Yunchengibacter salinarum]|uniref:D-alanine--D-alanine ligase n=1 Tax=Yunchengibacter salinarum TaxID=3133399 RepID=UPI0035B5B83C